jgi:hypothetical protein
MVLGTVFTIFIIVSGGYKYATKSGKADKRFKNNEYLSTFPVEFQVFSASGLMGCILYLVLRYYDIIDSQLLGLIVSK